MQSIARVEDRDGDFVQEDVVGEGVEVVPELQGVDSEETLI